MRASRRPASASLIPSTRRPSIRGRGPGAAWTGLLGSVSILAAVVLVAAAEGGEAHQGRNALPTWNPWGKESPEPYGYDVMSAPDLPLGYVDPADPPITLPPGPAADPRLAVLGVTTTVDRTAYSWFGRITVTAEVLLDGVPAADCDSVIALSGANPRVRARLADDGIAPDAAAGDGRYTGSFDIGAWEGEARPSGSSTVTATAYRGTETGFDVSPSFAVYAVRRWTGITTGGGQDLNDAYTAFFVTSNGPGAGYHHTIRDLGLVRSTPVTDAQIRIPILPAANAVAGVTVTGNGVSGVAVRDNVIEFDCNLSFGTVTRVTIEFDAPSDLAATRIDRYQTGDIALRDFRNGYLVWNRFIHTAILGSGYTSPHGPGCIVDLHVTDLETGAPHSVDCMERVAVHLDNAAFNDGSGTYPSNIKWGGEALSWYEAGSLDSLAFRFVSGGGYGLAGKVQVDRRVVFATESRLFRHRYLVRNVDSLSHDFDFVWGREQWLYGSAPGSDRQEDDRGLLPNDDAAYGGEHGFAPAQVDGNWLAAFDRTSSYAIGVVLPEAGEPAMPTATYFLCNAPLGNFTGEYPIIPSGTCTDMENLFFEKRLGVLAPDQAAAIEFHQWGGYGADRRELTEILWRDAVSLSGEPLVIAYAPLGDEVPVTSSIEVRFNHGMDHATTEPAFRITPTVEGSFEWADEDRLLRFRPSPPLATETIYNVEISRAATDQEGHSLASAADWYFETSGETAAAPSFPDGGGRVALRGASPNPSAGSGVQIDFDLAEGSPARLTLLDVRGRLVAAIAEGEFTAGRNAVHWDGKDARGEPAPAGVYFLRLDCAGVETVRKLAIHR